MMKTLVGDGCAPELRVIKMVIIERVSDLDTPVHDI